MAKEDDEWITVKKRKKKTTSLNKDGVFEYEDPTHTPRVVFLDEEYDPLSLLVYYVLVNNDFPKPSSFITKEIKRLLKSKDTPIYIKKNKHLFKKEYTKKDIGYALYEGPLSKIVVKDESKIPRLWSLK